MANVRPKFIHQASNAMASNEKNLQYSVLSQGQLGLKEREIGGNQMNSLASLCYICMAWLVR